MSWPARLFWVAVVGVVSAVMGATLVVRSADQHGALTSLTKPAGPLFGASASDRAWLAHSTSEFGHLPIIRTYYTGLPASNVWTSGADGFNKSAVIVSFEALPSQVLSGADDAALTKFFDTAPTGHPIYYAYYHEAEAHVVAHQFTTAQYRAAWAHVVMLANRAHNPDLKSTLILMAWTLNKHSGLNWKDFLPGGGIISTLAWDAYPAGTVWNDNPQLTPPAQFMGPEIAASRSVGLPFGFAEFALGRASGRPQWLKEVANYLMGSGALFGVLFNSPRYPTMEVTDSASMAAWRSVVLRSGTDNPLPGGGAPAPAPPPIPAPLRPGLVIKGLAISPATFAATGKNHATITFRLTQAANVTVFLLGSGGQVVHMTARPGQKAGAVTITYYGYGSTGNHKLTGTFPVLVVASNAHGSTSAEGSLTITKG